MGVYGNTKLHLPAYHLMQYGHRCCIGAVPFSSESAPHPEPTLHSSGHSSHISLDAASSPPTAMPAILAHHSRLSRRQFTEPPTPVQARKNLEFVRGTHDVDKEFNDLVDAAELAKQVKHPWKNMFSRKYRPQLVLCACSTLFQQWTGCVAPALGCSIHLPYRASGLQASARRPASVFAQQHKFLEACPS